MSDGTLETWKPTQFVQHVNSLGTSMGTAEIVTDEGRAYIKALGNPEGPHQLACEWVGTKLAKWFGLATFEIALMTVDKEDEIPFLHGGLAQPGVAFVSRAENGHPWGGSASELEVICNKEDIARLVIFDMWTQNCDRHPPDLTTRKPNTGNVFLSYEKTNDGQPRLMAMDHTHCFTCGHELNEQVAFIDRIQDERIYGLFPGFKPFLAKQKDSVRTATNQLRRFNSAMCAEITGTIPDEWEVSKEIKSALCKLICRRASFVADNAIQWLTPICWPQGEFDYDGESEDA